MFIAHQIISDIGKNKTTNKEVNAFLTKTTAALEKAHKFDLGSTSNMLACIPSEIESFDHDAIIPFASCIFQTFHEDLNIISVFHAEKKEGQTKWMRWFKNGNGPISMNDLIVTFFDEGRVTFEVITTKQKFGLNKNSQQTNLDEFKIYYEIRILQEFIKNISESKGFSFLLENKILKKESINPNQNSNQLYYYRVLDISKIKKIVRSEADSLSQRSGPRLHERRGHFRKLKNGKKIWIKDQIVGEKEKGEVFKDYKIH